MEWGWGPRLRRGADSLRSLDKARDGEPAEPLAGDHAYGVTALQNGEETFYKVIKVDDFAKSHQRAPCGAPESMTGKVSH